MSIKNVEILEGPKLFLKRSKKYLNLKYLKVEGSCKNPLRDEYFRAKDKDFYPKSSILKQI